MKRQTKIKRHLVYFLLLSCCLMVLTTACKSKKGIVDVGEIRNEEELFIALLDNSLDYKTFSGKMKASLPMGKLKVDAVVSLRIIKDEKIQLSFQVPLLGEMVRLGVSEDSLIIIDRMNKQYVFESIQNIKKNIDFNFNVYNIQSLFTNHLFIGGEKDITMKDFHLFSIQQTKERKIIKTKESRQNIDYSFIIDNENHLQDTFITGAGGNITVNWRYNDFSSLENKQQFPKQMTLTLAKEDNRISADFIFSKIELDKHIEIDFKAPNKYDRVTLEEAMLIKSMKQ